jgi:hypothetical protein
MRKTIKEYIITYRSNEHYEVLGWVRAPSADKALKKARVEFKDDIEKYGIINATIAEWRGVGSFNFSDL